MQIEPNNIYCGDCYKLIKEIPDKSIDCIYTDIPYLMINGKNLKSYSKLSDSVSKKIANLNEISSGIDLSILDEFKRVMKKVNIYIWCSKLQILDILTYFKDYNFEILVWCKTNPQPAVNGIWLPDVEYCLYFRESGVPLNQDFYVKSKYYISSINTQDKKLFDHPTIKPLELVERHLKHTTQPNDIVLDPFLGSGTTAVACKALGRKYIGFELNKDYYKIAVDRLNNTTQQEKRAGVIKTSLF